jgi:hypothetical protein
MNEGRNEFRGPSDVPAEAEKDEGEKLRAGDGFPESGGGGLNVWSL